MKLSTIILGVVFSVSVADSQLQSQLSDVLIDPQVPNGLFTYEEHFVTTADGYNLTLSRLYKNSTSPRSKYPVLLSHGILTNGRDWTISGKPKSIAFEVADENMDVWMLSSRKNMVSNAQDPRFYNYSYHEMGIYDLPATIDFILDKTGKEQVVNVGFSQGGAAFYAMFSELPEMNAKIRSAHILAPAPLRLKSKSSLLSKISDLLINLLRGVLNIVNPIRAPNNLNATTSATVPAASSAKQTTNSPQLLKSSRIRDYCNEGLLVCPTKYNLGLVTVPVYLYYSDKDSVTSVQDVNELAMKLGNVKGKFLIRNYSHEDFLYAKDASTKVYNKIVSLLDHPTRPHHPTHAPHPTRVC